MNRTVGISGGAARITGMLAARKRWTGESRCCGRENRWSPGASRVSSAWRFRRPDRPGVYEVRYIASLHRQVLATATVKVVK
ncbi:MAG: hypothetical protein ABFS37_15070 [Acidobacteriota bacterium]